MLWSIETILPYFLSFLVTNRIYNDYKERTFPYLATLSIFLLIYFQGYKEVNKGFCPIGYPERHTSPIDGELIPSLITWECSGNFIMLCLNIFLCIDEVAAMYRHH